MSSENVRRRKQEKRYSFVFVPSEEGSRTRTFSLTRLGIAGAAIAAVVALIGVVLLVLIYTPVGRLLPIAHPELEYVYGRQLVDIQTQLGSLLSEMTTLRAYNIRLRRALGENVSNDDSVFAAHQEGSGSAVIQTHTGEEQSPSQGEFERQLRSSLRDTTGDKSNISLAGLNVEQPVTKITADLPFGTPAHGYYTSSFDNQKKHLGIDIAGKEGSPVFAAAGGRIIFASWTYDDGFQIIVGHDKGYMTIYKHNQALLRNVGDVVKRGEIISLMGNTGRTSSGPHLHFEIWKDGSVLDPMNYLLTLE